MGHLSTRERRPSGSQVQESFRPVSVFQVEHHSKTHLSCLHKSTELESVQLNCVITILRGLGEAYILKVNSLKRAWTKNYRVQFLFVV